MQSCHVPCSAAYHFISLRNCAPRLASFSLRPARLHASGRQDRHSKYSCYRSTSRCKLGTLMAAAPFDATVQIAEAQPVQDKGEMTEFPSSAGVYAVYSADKRLQYIGLSRKIAASIASHIQELPDLTQSVKYEVVDNSTKEALTAKWQEWIQEAVRQNGEVPPGNAKGNTTWAIRRSAARPEIKLTPGKGLRDLTCSVEDLIDQVVKNNKVVAFVKGTRTQPQCGFSFKVLSILNESRTQYEVVNVLDEMHNPGLREAIKSYSQWPTIPQLYVNGEFIGGSDIVEEMHSKGELQQLLSM